ncbi:hypothetical protein J4440_02505 [Candidatus Woesearchaeota archaeon]|nr:hypothetical protein [Candidatus Woesearchaeota archaeon]
MTEDYIPRLLEYVVSLDYAIADRKSGLEALRQCVGKPTDDPIRLWGPAEALASFEGAKRRLFDIFPELKEHYKENIEDKLGGE